MKFDFGEVLTRAWKIIWKFKVLWIFGILASCGSGGNSSGNSNSQGGSGGMDGNAITRDIEWFFRDAVLWFEKNTWVIFALIGFIIVLWFIQFTLAQIGHIGLIRGGYHADRDVEALRFGELWSESLTYFWRIVGLSLTVWGPILVVLIAVGVAFVIMIGVQPTGYDKAVDAFFAIFGLFVLVFCCCLIPFMILLGLYYSQAMRAMLLEDMGLVDSLKRGWEVFSGNFIGLAVMGVVLFIINMIISVVIAIPVYIAVVPLVFSFAAGTVDTWTPILITIAVLCAYSPIAIVLNGIMESYIQTVWTLIYMRVTDLGNKRKNDQPIDNLPILIEPNA